MMSMIVARRHTHPLESGLEKCFTYSQPICYPRVKFLLIIILKNTSSWEFTPKMRECTLIILIPLRRIFCPHEPGYRRLEKRRKGGTWSSRVAPGNRSRSRSLRWVWPALARPAVWRAPSDISCSSRPWRMALCASTVVLSPDCWLVCVCEVCGWVCEVWGCECVIGACVKCEGCAWILKLFDLNTSCRSWQPTNNNEIMTI